MIRFHEFTGRRNSAALGAEQMTAFLSALATRDRVAASTQNQALAAILFLYRDVLGQDLPWLDNLVRAKTPARIPVVLTRDEVHSIPEPGRSGWTARVRSAPLCLPILPCSRSQESASAMQRASRSWHQASPRSRSEPPQSTSSRASLGAT
jgi:hypothetical protein